MFRKILFFCLVLTVIRAEATVISNSANTCMEGSTQDFARKIGSYESFKKIDDSKLVSVFHQANLIFSEVQKGFSKSNQTAVFFAIQPLPILQVIHEVPRNLHPRFIALCSATATNLSCNLDATSAHATSGRQFAVTNFTLNIGLTKNNDCSTGWKQNLNYSITIDDQQYQKIVDDIKANVVNSPYIDDLAKVDVFLGNYWKAFFRAWDAGDWLE